MMNSIFDEYFDKLRTLPCFTKLDGREDKTSLLIASPELEADQPV